MVWVDREYRDQLRDDWRYTRLFRLEEHLREARMPPCTNAGCNGGQITMRDADGNTTTVTCDVCGGSGIVAVPVDNEDDGRAGGR